VRIALVITHIGGAAGGGGGIRQLLELAGGLRELGHDVTIACHDHDPRTDFDVSGIDDVEIRSVRSGVAEVPSTRLGIPRSHWIDMRRVAKLVPRDVDVVNAHDSPALRAGYLASRRSRVPLVWTRNDESILEAALIPDETIVTPAGPRDRLGRLGLFWNDLLYARRAAAVAVLDTRNARMVRRAYRREATIVRSGPSASFFERRDRAAARRRLGLADGSFLALTAGIMFPHRRFEDLIAAVAAIDDDAGVRGLIVGSDARSPEYGARLSELVRELGVEDRVEVRRESVSDDELRDMLAAADAFVFPHRHQTWGLMPLEALAGGTPVVVSTGAGVHEVLEGRPGVHVVPPEASDALAAALRDLRAGGAEGVDETREWIRDELSRRRYAERMVDVFDAARAAGR
jgi:glycosyltransferase involved in cell wall biosynthesis